MHVKNVGAIYSQCWNGEFGFYSDEICWSPEQLVPLVCWCRSLHTIAVTEDVLTSIVTASDDQIVIQDHPSSKKVFKLREKSGGGRRATRDEGFTTINDLTCGVATDSPEVCGGSTSCGGRRVATLLVAPQLIHRQDAAAASSTALRWQQRQRECVSGQRRWRQHRSRRTWTETVNPCSNRTAPI